MSAERSDDTVLMSKGLTKSYGKVRALRGVDLEVLRGEVFGFLGPNGAGKTTTIRCLLDAIRPDRGTLRVLGMDPQANSVAVQARTGYLPGELRMYDNLTAESQLRFLSDMRGAKADWGHVRQLAQQLDLDLTTPIKMLDEPTAGLDPLMQKKVLGLIRQANADGATVFFSSHIISEVQILADRVAMIREGVIVEVAETSSLIERALIRTTVRFKQPVDSGALANVPGVTVLSWDDHSSMTLQVKGDMDALVKALGSYPVRDLMTARPSLEEVFLAYYMTNHKQEESS